LTAGIVVDTAKIYFALNCKRTFSILGYSLPFHFRSIHHLFPKPFFLFIPLVELQSLFVTPVFIFVRCKILRPMGTCCEPQDCRRCRQQMMTRRTPNPIFLHPHIEPILEGDNIARIGIRMRMKIMQCHAFQSFSEAKNQSRGLVFSRKTWFSEHFHLFSNNLRMNTIITAGHAPLRHSSAVLVATPRFD
jgi:hypothetical protein